MTIRAVFSPLEKVAQAYSQKPRLRGTVNAVALYWGSRSLGLIDGVSQDLVNMAAPVLTGAFVNDLLNKDEVCNSDNLRFMGKVGLAGCVGWDLADKLSEYRGNIDALEYLRNSYWQVHSLVSRYTDIDQEGATAGMGCAIGAFLGKAYARRKR